MLKRDFNIFQNVRMFSDHQSDNAAKEYPGGRMQDYVANLKSVYAESDGTIRGQAVIIDKMFEAKLDALAKNDLLDTMGVSIRAYGRGVTKEVDGRKVNFVEALDGAESVDFVVRPAAGGSVDAIAESEGAIYEQTGFVESYGTYRVAEQHKEFRELNRIVEKLGRRSPTFVGDEETVQDFVRLGFSLSTAEALAETAKSLGARAALKEMEYADFWKALKER